MGYALKSKRKGPTWEEMSEEEKNRRTVIAFICFIAFIVGIAFVIALAFEDKYVPEIKLVSMDFAATVNNDCTIQQSHYGRPPLVSARWDLLIRVPKELIGNYMCLQGNLQASFLYKNVTLVTSSPQRCNILEPHMPQLLNVSAVATEEDLGGAIGKSIIEAMKERNEVRFGSRLSLTDCREEAEKVTMSYECDETTLGFEPSGSDDQIKASAFGKRPNCKISR